MYKKAHKNDKDPTVAFVEKVQGAGKTVNKAYNSAKDFYGAVNKNVQFAKDVMGVEDRDYSDMERAAEGADKSQKSTKSNIKPL